MKKILITGACGQIGTELAAVLEESFGRENVIATDIKKTPDFLKTNNRFMYLDVLNISILNKILVENDIDTIFHMAAILSVTGERNPQQAYQVNLNGLVNILEAARKNGINEIIVPSSIAVFGPDVPSKNTPNNAPLNPITMYGVTKVAGEKLLQYYHFKYGLNTRSLRYPGIISHKINPGGGTTDFAIDMYMHAIQNKEYICYLKKNTPLPFMYMPDAIKAIRDLANAEPSLLTQRIYNVNSLELTPQILVDSIQTYIPEFRCSYQPDFRQTIADSWPQSIDDRLARRDWQWQPNITLDNMTKDMLEQLKISAA